MKTEISILNAHFNVATRARRRGLVVRWDHAHTRAYEFISWMLVAGLFMAYFLHPNPIAPLLGRYAKTIADNAAYTFIISGLIVYFTLPQTTYLWTEPDMEQQ